MEKIEKDYARYSQQKPSVFRILYKFSINAAFRAVVLYRIGNWFRKHSFQFMAALIERVMHHLCHCWISTTAEIGHGFLIAHAGGLVISGGTIIGNNCDVRHNVTFGGNFNRVDQLGRQMPELGNNISVGVGAAILGPVRIGSNSIIGANSVVTKDVPDGVIVQGVPATILKQRWDETSGRKLCE